MTIFKSFISLLAGSLLLMGKCDAAMDISWGKEPVEKGSATRQQICLNGVWQFCPAEGEFLKEPPKTEGAWGKIRVPGSWKTQSWRPVFGVEVERGTGPQWDKDYERLVTINSKDSPERAWYRRPLAIPANWQGKRISLRFEGIGTDAEVFIGGKMAGEVLYPGGELDVTALVRPGQTSELVVRVVVAGPEEVEVLMGYANDGAKVANTISPRGLLDDVFVEASPSGARIEHPVIRTSTRKGEIAVETEVVDAGSLAGWKLRAEARSTDGAVLRAFPEVPVEVGKDGRISAAWPWTDAPLWSLDNPQMIELALQLVGPQGAIADERVERIGFREFWIEGRDFYLNGVKTRLRPAMNGTPMHLGFVEVIDGLIDRYKAMGFNYVEMWPRDLEDRSLSLYMRLFAERAAEKGLLVNGIAPHLRSRTGETAPMDDAALAEFRKTARDWMVKHSGLINIPSVVIWGTSGNTFFVPNASGRSSPRGLGRVDLSYYYEPGSSKQSLRARFEKGMKLVAEMKAVDPSRPMYSHHGGAIGDFHTENMYLNFMPLQEREEFLSHWAEHGEKPFMVVEHGDPFDLTVHRGRAGFGNSIVTEPLRTEYLAAYAGPEIYAKENPNYRSMIALHFVKDQQYRAWFASMLLAPGGYFEDPNFLDLLELFTRHTGRAWRAWGHSGGVVAWQMRETGWVPRSGKAEEFVEMPPFEPGRRGMYASRLPLEQFDMFSLKPDQLTQAGRALVEINQPVLGFIGGFDHDSGSLGNGFVDKRHHYTAGDLVEKQIVLINDRESPQEFKMRWSAKCGSQPGGDGEVAGTLKPGEIAFRKIDFQLPETLADAKVDGEIRLEGTIGGQTVEDQFGFRVFRAAAHGGGPAVALFDPAGETRRMFEEIGIETKPWKPGDPAPEDLLVVGRRALEGSESIPPEIRAFIEGGGRCVLMAQDPDWLREKLGLRVAWHLTRRGFPVGNGHPVLAGLDASDLRDWAGDSTLVPARPDQFQREGAEGDPVLWGPCGPYAGWRWGNRGAISSAAVETPHHGGWTPLIASDFDLAYSPLLEKPLGAGWLALCLLDLEDHVAVDPAARRLAVQFFDHAREVVPSPALPVVGIGLGPWTRILEETGLVFEDAAKLPSPPAIAVIGPESTISRADFDGFLDRGGRALVLPGDKTFAKLGVNTRTATMFSGSTDIPDWPETAGIGPSDLRLRADMPWTLIEGGCETGASGLLGKRQAGDGVAIFVQFNPSALDADKKTYQRFTRWRQTRALCQILGNLGARFNSDRLLFEPAGAAEIPLNRGWRAALIHRVEAPARIEDRIRDKGISPEAVAAVAPGFDDSQWREVSAPRAWEEYGREWFNADGEAVFRFHVDVPIGWAGKDLELGLGRIHAFDETFWNGQPVGKTGTDVKGAFKVNRQYTIPGNMVRPGPNVIAVRIYNDWSDGGFRGLSADMFLRPARSGGGHYHPDYRSDFEFGDDPFRYYNW